MIVTILGAPGNMGTKVVETLLKEDNITKMNLLVHRTKGSSKLINKIKKSKKKYKVIFGTITNYADVKDVVSDADYVIKVTNSGAQKGVKKLIVNGKEIAGNIVPMQPAGSKTVVEVEM